MKVITIKICWLNKNISTDLAVPSYQTAGSSGLDIRAAVEYETHLNPQEIVIIPTGFALEIPEGYEGQIRPRSGLAVTHGVTLINSPGTIDSDYRGEIKVPLINHGKVPFAIKRGERIAQLVFAEVCRVSLQETENLDYTQRGDGGFGHTGR